jgi:NAD(P)-dependent dehydrogenase (short-subunit alcohol dehydrogenase family)
MQRILITGASRGIGRAIAVRLAGPDKLMLLHGRDRQALEATGRQADARGARTLLLPFDLADPTQVVALVREVASAPLNVLINNAGVSFTAPLTDQTLEEWQATLAVNVTAPFLLCRGLVPVMPEGATIVNIISSAGKVGFSTWSSYCMSKFALDGFGRAIREELRPKGIRVINVFPSATDTDIWKSVPGEWPREKMMRPENVADAVASALEQPADVMVEEITIGSISGRL